jgi:transcriptional repressor NrdR
LKHDGSTEEFERAKLFRSISIACAKRPVTQDDIDALVDGIEDALTGQLRSEVPASRIGELVMERLAPLDRVAYIRFASVYRNFQDIGEFQEVVRDLNTKEQEQVRSRNQEELPL